MHLTVEAPAGTTVMSTPDHHHHHHHHDRHHRHRRHSFASTGMTTVGPGGLPALIPVASPSVSSRDDLYIIPPRYSTAAPGYGAGEYLYPTYSSGAAYGTTSMQYPAQYGATVAPSYYGTPYGATTALPGAQYSAVPAYGSSAYGYGQPYGYYPSSTSYRSTSRHHGHHGHYGYGHGYIADAEQKVVGGLEKFAGYVTGDPMLVERGRRRQMSTSYVPTSAYGSGRYAYGTPRGYYY